MRMSALAKRDFESVKILVDAINSLEDCISRQAIDATIVEINEYCEEEYDKYRNTVYAEVIFETGHKILDIINKRIVKESEE